MTKQTVIFYPFRDEEISYIYMMQRLISTEYCVVDYDIAKYFDIASDVRCIYLNWIENVLSTRDKIFLEEAKSKNIKIIWVFHNKFPHDEYGKESLMDNMRYMSHISDIIILHSRSSEPFIYQYVGENKAKKIFVPHINFIKKYGTFGEIVPKLDKNTFVFLALGLIRKYKNIEILIKAFNQFSMDYNAKLLIAGEASSHEYLTELEKLAEDNSNIIIHGHRISSLEMGTYLDTGDVMVFPYDIRSGMNSGAMIMGFSYCKPAIVSHIAMADEYSDALIYKYSYENEDDHINKLRGQLEKAYIEGKTDNALRGMKLYQIVKDNNSYDSVKNKLLEIL